MTQAERIYYDRRAAEYDNWYLGTGVFAARDRPGWHAEVAALIRRLRGVGMRTVLDAACGTAFLTQHLAGDTTALDQSMAMLRIARRRVPGGRGLQGDALQPPFGVGTFECVTAAHFYGHLNAEMRQRFLGEAPPGSWWWMRRGAQASSPRKHRSACCRTDRATEFINATSRRHS
ncbi:MAG TPA: class I SAM-dependent methyltransferase [Bryobacteraceae bacterium]|nr:class I SAM-dependent methyltransferase [Bryobacteraceae bacterium]